MRQTNNKQTDVQREYILWNHKSSECFDRLIGSRSLFSGKNDLVSMRFNYDIVCVIFYFWIFESECLKTDHLKYIKKRDTPEQENKLSNNPLKHVYKFIYGVQWFNWALVFVVFVACFLICVYVQIKSGQTFWKSSMFERNVGAESMMNHEL